MMNTADVTRPIAFFVVMAVSCVQVGAAADRHQDDKAVRVDRVVFPTGTFPEDVQNIQAAVDRGGTVRLKATNRAGRPTAFNFGTPEDGENKAVFLGRDIAVIGERARGQMTTIQGGFIGFIHPLSRPAARSRIEGILFDGQLLSAIIIARSTGTDIIGNHVRRTVGAPFLGSTEGRGIKFLGSHDPDGAITGRVRILDNVIEDLHADFSDAIVLDEVAAEVEIAGNRIGTTQSAGIFILRSKGKVSIHDNVIVPGPGDPAPKFSIGNAIFIFGSRESAVYEIVRNRILCENPSADGIVLAGITSQPIERPVVKANRIEMRGSRYGAVTLLGAVSNGFVGFNRIRGDGHFALDVAECGFSGLAVRNRFACNDIHRFDARFNGADPFQCDPNVAHVFLDSHTRDTAFRGDTGSLIDRGTDNVFLGACEEEDREDDDHHGH